MLLRREVALGVQIVGVSGPVTEADLPTLRAAVVEAAASDVRGVLLDLSGATSLAPAVVDAVRELKDVPRLQVCCSSTEVVEALSAAVPVVPGREEGLAHADDRRSAPRRVIDLEAGVQSPAVARAVTADVVAAMHLEPIGDDLALVVSELVTNAVRHAAPPVRLEIQADDTRVTIAVADGSPGRPQQRAANENAEGGRGMQLVDLLAEQTGCRPNPPGKTVWAALPRKS